MRRALAALLAGLSLTVVGACFYDRNEQVDLCYTPAEHEACDDRAAAEARFAQEATCGPNIASVDQGPLRLEDAGAGGSSGARCCYQVTEAYPTVQMCE